MLLYTVEGPAGTNDWAARLKRGSRGREKGPHEEGLTLTKREADPPC